MQHNFFCNYTECDTVASLFNALMLVKEGDSCHSVHQDGNTGSNLPQYTLKTFALN